MEIKPCPFCNNKGEMYTFFGMYGIGCSNPKCIVYTGYGYKFHNTEEEAIKAWNTRQSHACYADEVTHRNCKYSVHRGWCEHGCKPIGEWRKTSQAQEVRERTCGCCGEEFGMDRRNGFPIPLESLCELPNYCPNCGTKVAKE